MKPDPVSHRRVTAGGAPSSARPYLEEQTTLRVRFNEVDALQVVWHGHYVNFFEEGRRAFGRRYGVDYTVFLEHQVAIPVIQLRLDYVEPARLADTIEINARLLKSESARMDFEYEIRKQDNGRLLASGSTTQVFTTPAGELLLTWPAFMIERLKAWEPLWIQPEKNSPPSKRSNPFS